MSLMQRLFGKKEPAQASSAEDAVPHDRPTLTKDFTGQPEEAVDILFGEAMAALPELTADQLSTAHARLQQAWGSLPLVEGSESEIRDVLLRNAQALAKTAAFKGFEIKLCLPDMGFEGEEAAQLYAWVGTSGFVVRVWKSEGAFHAYGRPEFLGGEPTV